MILELATLGLAALSDEEGKESENRIRTVNGFRSTHGVSPLTPQEILGLCLEEPPCSERYLLVLLATEKDWQICLYELEKEKEGVFLVKHIVHRRPGFGHWDGGPWMQDLAHTLYLPAAGAQVQKGDLLTADWMQEVHSRWFEPG